VIGLARSAVASGRRIGGAEGCELKRLRALLAPLSHHDFTVLWTSQLLSELGDWAARVALAILVERRTGSAALTGLVTTVSLLPYVGSGWLLSGLADRFPRRTVMIVCDLARAAVFAAIVLPLPVWALLTLVFLAACLTPPFESARAALLPLTVPRQTYGDAIALAQVTGELMLLLGFVSGGLLSAAFSPKGAVLVNVGTFVVSAAVLGWLRLGREPAIAESGVRPGVRAGIRAVFGDPFVRRFTMAYSIAGGCAIAGEALAAAYVAENLISTASGGGTRAVTAALTGVLTAAVPVGVIVTTLVMPKGADDTASMRIAGVVATIGSAAAIGLFLLDPPMPVVLLAYASLGIVFASRIPANQVAGLRIPDEVRASAFGILAGVVFAAQGLGALLGGIIGDRVGVRQAIIAFLVVGGAVSVYSALAPPRESATSAAKGASAGGAPDGALDRSSTAMPSGSRGSANR
jgi:MFS family permease